MYSRFSTIKLIRFETLKGEKMKKFFSIQEGKNSLGAPESTEAVL